MLKPPRTKGKRPVEARVRRRRLASAARRNKSVEEILRKGDELMAENIVKLDDFEGEVAEHWQDARGRKVIDKNGDEVGTVEELFIWEDPSTVHLIAVSGDERTFLIPVH